MDFVGDGYSKLVQSEINIARSSKKGKTEIFFHARSVQLHCDDLHSKKKERREVQLTMRNIVSTIQMLSYQFCPRIFGISVYLVLIPLKSPKKKLKSYSLYYQFKRSSLLYWPGGLH